MRVLQPLRRRRGATIVETIMVMPVLLMMGMGILHFALLAQAKSNLDYATLMAARIASTRPFFGITTDQNLPLLEVARRMEASDSDALTNLDRINLCILRPNANAFADFGRPNIVPGSRSAIPNDNLPFRSTAAGGRSQLSIQDANILHLQVSYYYDTKVPFMNFFDDAPDPIVHDVGNATAPQPYVEGRTNFSSGIYLRSETVLVMQTHAARSASSDRYIQGTETFRPCR